VGGVSGRAGAKAGGSDPSAYHLSFAWRNGERHPGLLEGISLRGALSERGPWSVRRLLWVSSHGRTRADDSGCPEDAEEGNAVSMRDKAHAPDAGTRDRCMRQGTRPSLGPSTRARRSSLCSAGASLGGGAVEGASRLGKPG